VSTTTGGQWLEGVFRAAEASHWCTRPYCTTCGTRDFRRAFWSGAAWQAGVATHGADPTQPRDFPSEFSVAECENILQALIEGLRLLPASRCATDGFRTIIYDIDPPFLRFGTPIDLDAELGDSPAGRMLARLRARSALRRERQAQREEFNSPEAAAERRRLRIGQRARDHEARQAETRRRNLLRVDTINSLAAQSVQERLSRFATDLSLNLDSVPMSLIPALDSDVDGIEPEVAAALIARIGRRRRGWGRLRQLLQRLIVSAPAAPASGRGRGTTTGGVAP